MRTLLPLLLLAAAAPAGDGLDELKSRMRAAREAVFPALVHIMNVEDVFVNGRLKKSVSTGSGFIIDEKGLVVTNDHVAGKAQRLVVTLAGGKKVPARLVAADPYTDLALIQFDSKEAFPDGRIPTAKLGNSSKVGEGDFVLAMGSPLSLSRSISFGVISCRDRVLNTMRIRGHETGKYNTWFQTDAAINPGNSGGPLVNLAGEVIGVNTRANLMANNIGFAIPSDVVRRVVEALQRSGVVPRSFLGLTLQPLDDLADSALAAKSQGALVAAVAVNSPALRAGIQPGDVVTHLGGTPFSARFQEELPGLYHRIAELPPGKPAKLAVMRSGEPGAARTVTVTPEKLGIHLDAEIQIATWGLTVRGITPRMARELNLPDTAGVIVTGIRAGSASGRSLDGGASALQRGFVILKLQGDPIPNRQAFETAVAKLIAEKASPVRIVFRTGNLLDVTVLLPSYKQKAVGEDDGD